MSEATKLIALVLEGFSPEQLIENYMLPTKRGSHHPDAKRSRAAKERWRKYRSKYLAAHRRFNTSAAGKTFHRKLGRFNSRRSR